MKIYSGVGNFVGVLIIYITIVVHFNIDISLIESIFMGVGLTMATLK